MTMLWATLRTTQLLTEFGMAMGLLFDWVTG
jgi:hypothetical protein